MITATAANHVNSPEVSVVVDSAGQAWVRSGTSPVEINRRTGDFLHIQEEEKVEVAYYPIKILFSLENQGALDLYVGGDRPTPKKIFTISSSDRAKLISTHFSNTGKTINDFAIGLKFSDKLITIYSSTNYTYQGLGFDKLVWIGCGFWSYSLEGRSPRQVNVVTTTTGTTTTTTADYTPENTTLLSGGGSYRFVVTSTGGGGGSVS